MCQHSGQPEDFAYPFPLGMKYSDMDVFHELIVVDEVSRCGSGGVTWGLMGGLGIGLPPVLLFAEGTASKHCNRMNRVFLTNKIYKKKL